MYTNKNFNKILMRTTGTLILQGKPEEKIQNRKQYKKKKNPNDNGNWPLIFREMP